jgi:hypothetical protein
MKKIKIKEINTTEFCLVKLDTNIKSNKSYLALKKSIAQLDQQYPILVWAQTPNSFILIDGYKRLLIAKETQQMEISCIVLQQEILKQNIAGFILAKYYATIQNYPILKILFIELCQSMGLEKKQIIEFFKQLELNPKDWNNYKNIINLPLEIKEYCLEKKFSIKQCIMINNYPLDILNLVMHWQTKILLTASIFLEITENIFEFLRISNKTVLNIEKNENILAILSSENNISIKTNLLRNHLKSLRYPTLEKINEKLTKTKEKLKLPKNIKLNWDYTLEEKELQFLLKIKSKDEWNNTIQNLKSITTPAIIDKLLQEF